jgi:hypothetical protein
MGRILGYFGLPVAVHEPPATTPTPHPPRLRWNAHTLTLLLPTPGTGELHILDVLGRTVFRRSGRFSPVNRWTLHLPAGVYTVRLHWKGTWTHQRLVIPAH